MIDSRNFCFEAKHKIGVATEVVNMMHDNKAWLIKDVYFLDANETYKRVNEADLLKLSVKALIASKEYVEKVCIDEVMYERNPMAFLELGFYNDLYTGLYVSDVYTLKRRLSWRAHGDIEKIDIL